MSRPEQSIPTIWGNLSFEEFYKRTKRIVANKLKQYGLSNPEDIDDCMQSAYLKIWCKIKANPQIFSDKPLNYIIRAVFFASKAQRYSHIRHYNKVSFSNPEFANTDVISIQRIETWIDLQAAIIILANQSADNDRILFAMYTVLTQATVAKIKPILGCSNKTMTKNRNYVRKQLADLLPHYNHIHPEKPKIMDFSPTSVAIALLDTSSI